MPAFNQRQGRMVFGQPPGQLPGQLPAQSPGQPQNQAPTPATQSQLPALPPPPSTPRPAVAVPSWLARGLQMAPKLPWWVWLGAGVALGRWTSGKSPLPKIPGVPNPFKTP